MTVPSILFEEKIEKVTKLLLTQEQANCPVVHRFGPNIYIREVFIPAGTFAVGHYQRFEHMNILLKGKVTLIKEDNTKELLTAPMSFTLPKGRKVGYVHEDMIWLNIYSTTETDIEKLEEHFLDKNASPWKKEEQILLEDFSFIKESQDDFKDVITILGFTEKQVEDMSKYEKDLIPFPNGNYSCCLGDSKIHGKGLFATANIKEGEIIAPARLSNNRTPAGRYTNHSILPNAKMIKNSKEDIYLVSLTNIQGNLGGTLGEEITIDYYDSYILSREVV